MKKLMNKKAFTIMEMLIVVAIIAVLVAIAIPTFNSSLTKAKEAADVANIRAAYAAIQVEVITSDSVTVPKTPANFVKKAGEGATLNDEGKCKIAAKTGDATKTVVTYEATKIGLKGSETKHVYSWTIDAPIES